MTRPNNRRQLNNEGEGLIHLPGMDAHDHQTFCGHCWHSSEQGEPTRYEVTMEPATCPSCLRAFREATQLLAGLKRWKLFAAGVKL